MPVFSSVSHQHKAQRQKAMSSCTTEKSASQNNFRCPSSRRTSTAACSEPPKQFWIAPYIQANSDFHAFPSPAPRFPYVPRVPGNGEDVWHRGVSWQSCLVVGIGDWPRTSHRAREWYSSLGIFPQASDIRFVKLYMLAISTISQQATSERPKLFRWSRSWGEHSRGSFVILTA